MHNREFVFNMLMVEISAYGKNIWLKEPPLGPWGGQFYTPEMVFGRLTEHVLQCSTKNKGTAIDIKLLSS